VLAYVYSYFYRRHRSGRAGALAAKRSVMNQEGPAESRFNGLVWPVYALKTEEM
jgi:hypothetical protein